MRQRGRDEMVNIGEDCIHAFALRGSGFGNLCAKLVRANGREHGSALHVFQIIADPINDLVAVALQISHADRPLFLARADNTRL